VGFIESDKALIIYYLFIYVFASAVKKSPPVQLINCQLFDLLFSIELKSHMPETNNHFTQELLICAPSDLTMSNLAYTACLLEC